LLLNPLMEKIMDGNSEKTPQGLAQPTDGRRPWVEPKLSKLDMSATEQGPFYLPDLNFGS